jgi:hypothetical protein
VKFEVWDFCTFGLKMGLWDELIWFAPCHSSESCEPGRWGRWSKRRLVIFNFDGATVILTQCKPVCFAANTWVTCCGGTSCQQQMLHPCCKYFFGVMRVLSCCVHALIINDDTPGPMEICCIQMVFCWVCLKCHDPFACF